MKPAEAVKRYAAMVDALKAEGTIPDGRVAALLVVASVIDEHTIEISAQLEHVRKELDFMGAQTERIADRTGK